MTQEELYRLRQTGAEVQRILDAEGTMADQTAAAVGAAESANEAAQQVNDALQEVIETGDIPAATVAKVAEHTVQIGNLKALIFDISANNPTEGHPTPYANLAAALGEGGVNVPGSMRKGGMSVKFIQSSDNKYEQFRYMGTAVTGNPNPFLNTANWQGVDDEPAIGSENLVKSGGCAAELLTTNNRISEVSGGDVKTPYYAEFFSGPGKYGIIVPAPHSVGKETTIEIPDVIDGTYTISFLNINKQVASSLQITFLNKRTTISCPSNNAYFYRVIADGIVDGSVGFVLKTVSGTLPDALHGLSERTNNLEHDVNGYEEVDSTLDAETIPNNGYGFWVPVIPNSSVHIRCTDIGNRELNLALANSSKVLSGTYLLTSFVRGEAVVVIPETPVSTRFLRVAQSNSGIQSTSVLDILEHVDGIKDNISSLNNEIDTINEDIDVIEEKISDYHELRRYINKRTAEKTTAYLGTQAHNVISPYFNMVVASDFHTEIKALYIVAHFTADSEMARNSISLIHSCGDMVTQGNCITKTEFFAKIAKNLECFADVEIPWLCCQGNHDYNWEDAERGGNYINEVPTDAEVREALYDELYNRLSNANKANWHFPANNPSALYYYYDIPSYKVRIITLNEYELPRTIVTLNGVQYFRYTGTARVYSKEVFRQAGYPDYAGFNTHYNQEQVEWLIDVLDNTEDDWVVLFVKHTPWTDNVVGKIVKAFKGRESGEATVSALDGAEGYSVSFDFSNKTESHCMCINGHNHYHRFYLDSNLGVYVLQSPCTGAMDENNFRFKDDVTASRADILSVNENKACSLAYGLVKSFTDNNVDDNGNSYANNRIDL